MEPIPRYRPPKSVAGFTFYDCSLFFRRQSYFYRTRLSRAFSLRKVALDILEISIKCAINFRGYKDSTLGKTILNVEHDGNVTNKENEEVDRFNWVSDKLYNYRTVYNLYT